MRFKVKDPKWANSLLIRQLLNSHSDLISFSEVANTLEQAYLHAINQKDGVEARA
jgi:hypothetical protein